MGSDPAKHRGCRLCRDDEHVGGMVEHRAGDRAIPDRCLRKNRIHGQHVLHEREVCPVIGEVPEGDETREQRNGCDQRSLRETNGDHGGRGSCLDYEAELPALDRLAVRLPLRRPPAQSLPGLDVYASEQCVVVKGL